jgi:hypothetical protein
MATHLSRFLLCRSLPGGCQFSGLQLGRLTRKDKDEAQNWGKLLTHSRGGSAVLLQAGRSLPCQMQGEKEEADSLLIL